jgi:hypothetical protein
LLKILFNNVCLFSMNCKEKMGLIKSSQSENEYMESEVVPSCPDPRSRGTLTPTSFSIINFIKQQRRKCEQEKEDVQR